MSSNGYYTRKTVTVKQVHSNLDQQIIQITEDKLKIVLNEHIEYVEKKNVWKTPLGILITLLVVFATTNFKNAFFSADTWMAIFTIITITTAIWLFKSIYIAYNASTVDDIICKMKNNDS